jgi:vacuolar protein sorting-associated protein 29
MTTTTPTTNSTTTTTNHNNTSFGELVLIVGDMFIPDRTIQIPHEFQRMLLPGRMQHVFCTGNLGSSTATLMDELKLLAPHFYMTCGDYDLMYIDDKVPIHIHSNDSFSETHVIQIGSWKIGMIHGHQIIPYCPESLARIQRTLHVDILITGDTHHSEVTLYSNYCHINPVRDF